MGDTRRDGAHPWMPSSTDAATATMLEAVGVRDVEELFEQIPAAHRMREPLSLRDGVRSEAALRRHVESMLRDVSSTATHLSFLGAGAWPHYVPAICDEIASRSEFLTPVWGTPSSDHGRNQAWFEFASQLGELLDLDFVGLPVYSWGAAVGHALRMAARVTGRSRVLVPEVWDPERAAVLRTYAGDARLRGHLDVVTVRNDPSTGRTDLEHLSEVLGDDVAAVYVETPTYLGVVETEVATVCAEAHRVGALAVVGVDPLSLGVLSPPGEYDADIAVGPTQPLGVHLHAGGGVGGFIASRDEERLAREFPTLQVSIVGTSEPGERAFTMTLFEQSSYGSREEGNDWTGNSVYLWAVVNAVYMAVMGPQGFVELGEAVLRRSHAAAARLAALPGVSVRWPRGIFKEFVVDFSGTGRSVAHVNAGLLSRGIFGGKDLTGEHPSLDGCALYCVTEVHTEADVDRLVQTLQEVLG